MINPRELMIGNWVEIEGNPYQSTVYDIINVQADNRANAKPILLSPEILEKCGFTKTPAIKGSFNWYHKSGCFGLAYNKLQGLIFCSPFLDLPLTSLHQLQNLFYTNTGTELTITL